MSATQFMRHAAIATVSFLAFAACNPETTAPTVDPVPFVMTQAHLDAAKSVGAARDTAIVGDPFNAFGTDTVTTLHKIRDLVCNTSPTSPVAVGSIWVRRAYKYNGGVRGTLINDVVMVKRDSGYFPEGGDFEYITIPFDSAVDYRVHPNGILPAVSDTTHRGTGTKLQACITCHAGSGAGSDRLFSR
jgi:hypothetical protein